MKLFGFVCQCVYVRNDSQSLAMVAGHGLLHHKWLFCLFKGGCFWLVLVFFCWYFLEGETLESGWFWAAWHHFRFSALGNSVGDGASPPQHCWLLSCSQGSCFPRGRGSTSKSRFLSDSSLPCLACGCDRHQNLLVMGEQTSTFLGGPAAVQTLQAQTGSRIPMLGLCWNLASSEALE